MKKFYFVLMMAVCAIVIMLVAPTMELGYDFPLDSGVDKLMVAIMALIFALIGAVVHKTYSLLVWGLMVLVFGFCMFWGILPIGISSVIVSLIMCFIAKYMVEKYPEIKEYLMEPFKEDEDEEDE